MQESTATCVSAGGLSSDDLACQHIMQCWLDSFRRSKRRAISDSSPLRRTLDCGEPLASCALALDVRLGRDVNAVPLLWRRLVHVHGW